MERIELKHLVQDFPLPVDEEEPAPIMHPRRKQQFVEYEDISDDSELESDTDDSVYMVLPTIQHNEIAWNSKQIQ